MWTLSESGSTSQIGARAPRSRPPALALPALLLLALLGGCQVGPGPAVTTGDARASATAADEATLDPLARVAAAVVRIDVREVTYTEGDRRLGRGVGSGVIVSEDGYVLTNAHVVSPEAAEIVVTLASLERVPASLVGWDHWTDLALLKLDVAGLEARGLDFAVATFGRSRDLRPGQTVYALGTPNGLSRTVTRGIISNTNRYFAGSDNIRGHETGYFNTWLQTDAAINPGNSGGPLVNRDGEVIGINTRAYLGANNLGFAVPADTAREVFAALRQEGEVIRSYVGIRPAPLQDLEGFFELALNRGVLVNSIDPGSPAVAAGLRPGDIILDLNGEPLDGRFPEQLPGILARIAAFPLDSELQLTVKRDRETFPVTLKTEKLETRVGERFAFDSWGLSIQKVSRAMARESNLETDDGVLVIGTQPAFPAFEAGLRRGDIITKVNRQPLESLDQLIALYEQAAPGNEGNIFFEVRRNRQVTYLVLKPQ